MGEWLVFFTLSHVQLLRNHLNLPLYNESSFWRGARSYQPSPVGHDRCSHDRLIGIKHSLQGSARDLNYPVQNNNNAEPRKLSRQMAQTLYEIDSKPLNYSAQCQGSYSSSDTDSQDQSRIPKYNSQILGTSTRSLIQQVSYYYTSSIKKLKNSRSLIMFSIPISQWNDVIIIGSSSNDDVLASKDWYEGHIRRVNFENLSFTKNHNSKIRLNSRISPWISQIQKCKP